LKDRAVKIIELLRREYPNARTSLKFSNNFEVLVATMLSAQSTDDQVNRVTRRLFKKYRRPEDYANASLKELQRDIRSLGIFRNKAKHIKESARIIVKKFDSQVPRTMEELTSLPGVGRKTANIVLGNTYGIVEGIAVDTHVARLARRLGLTKHTTQDKIEKDLMRIIPREEWFNITNLLIAHGRAVCHARSPEHSKCVLFDLCPSRNI
jgi:endonuclease-3